METLFTVLAVGGLGLTFVLFAALVYTAFDPIGALDFLSRFSERE
jgi:hypothetical protein